MMLTDLATTLRKAGLTVAEEPGWKTRGHGAMTDVRTIVCHHTGGLKDMRVVRDGRPGLDGPLAHVWLARDGVWHLIAAGKCWHAGVVRRDEYANEHAIGIEAEATGVDPWPAVQYQSYARGCAALTIRYGVAVDHVLGHKEVCAPPGRKNDPNFDMGDFRALVTRERYELLNPVKPVEDDVPLSTDDIAKFLQTNLGHSGPTVGVALQSGYANTVKLTGEVLDVQAALSSLAEQMAALAAKVDALAPPPAAP